MQVLTRAQREALKRIYMREAATVKSNLIYEFENDTKLPYAYTHMKWRSYCAMRRAAIIAYGDCIMLQVGNIWLGIEPDGYTHS